MPLILFDNQLLLNGSSLAGSNSCCCTDDPPGPPIVVPTCEDCCPDTDEIAVRLSFFESGLFNQSLRGSDPVVTSWGPSLSVEVNGVFVLQKSPFNPCVYFYEDCNPVGNVVYDLELSVRFYLIENFCVPSASIRYKYRSCFNTMLPPDTTFVGGVKITLPGPTVCCDSSTFGGSQYENSRRIILGDWYHGTSKLSEFNFNNPINYRRNLQATNPPMTQPCRFAVSGSYEHGYTPQSGSIFYPNGTTAPHRCGCTEDDLRPAWIPSENGLVVDSSQIVVGQNPLYEGVVQFSMESV